MTVKEMKDSLDKMLQDYPFIENSEVLLKSDFDVYTVIDAIKVDKYCRPLIIINSKI